MQLVLSKRYKVIKVVVCLLLCLTVMAGTFYIQTQEVYAILPALILAPEAVGAIGSLLATLGITFASKAAVDVIVNKYLDSLDSATHEVRNKVANILALAQKLKDERTVVDVPDDVYTSAKTFVDENFSAGENQTYTSQELITVEFDNNYYLANYFENLNDSSGDFIYMPTSEYLINYGTYIKCGETYEIKKTENGYQVLKNGSQVCTANKDYNPYFVCLYENSSHTFYLCVNNYLYTTSAKYNLVILKQYSRPAVNNTFAYNGDATKIDNPTYDYKTADGKRQIEVKSTPEQLINVNGNDLINPVSGELTKPSHWVGKITDAMPGNYTFTGAGTISGLMDVNRVGTWDGTWAKTNTGAWTFEGTYTDAQSLTWEGVATQELEAENDTDVPFDPPAMKLPAPILRKFPFCIPWDFYNSFKTLLSPAQAPKWTIDFPKVYFVGGGSVTIDFNQFSTWAAIVRWAILILFNVGLIFATRKLIWK